MSELLENTWAIICSVLLHDERIWIDLQSPKNKDNLNYTKLLDLLENLDKTLISSLASNNMLKDKFFIKINDIVVFNHKDFKFFIEQNKINNSYTDYVNRIGLTDGKRFIKDTNDIVLNFPYKDCILEGGQSKDDGEDEYYEYDEAVSNTDMKKGYLPEQYNLKNTKRKEFFFNEVLAKDEIDRLKEPKAFINWKKYNKDGVKKVESLQRDQNHVIKDNLIIKGNNLLALYSLKEQFAGKIKLIYIDPPYNTGNDSFKYNDNFNHSTWLVFMKNRLEIALELLRDDGMIFIQCDDNEQAYLKVLMDEVFGAYRFVNTISIKMSEASGTKMAHVNSRFPKIKEYIHVYKKNIVKIEVIDYILKDKWDSEYKTIIENFTIKDRQIIKDIQNKEYNTQKDVAVVQEIFNKIKLTPLYKYKDFKDNLEWKKENAFRIIRTVSSDSLRKIVKSYKSLPQSELGCGLSNDNLIFFYNTTSNLDSQGRVQVVFADDFLQKHPCDMWYDIKTTGIAREGSITLQYGKKPEKILERIIKMTTQPGDVVLDFFLGSGTTASVAHKMGRHYIGIEQMDYIEDLVVARLTKVIGIPKIDTQDNSQIDQDITTQYQDYDMTGISKSVNWQGGGEFVYCELATWNEKAKEAIIACDSLQALVAIFDDTCNQYFLNYNVQVDNFKNKIIHEENFKKLPLEQHKAMFIKMLDLNQMYINKQEMKDTKYGLSDEYIILTELFYSKG